MSDESPDYILGWNAAIDATIKMQTVIDSVDMTAAAAQGNRAILDLISARINTDLQKLLIDRETRDVLGEKP